MSYKAPLHEQLFLLDNIADWLNLKEFENFSCLQDGLAREVLQEGSRLAENVFAPLNRIGDIEGLHWSADGITHPSGFASAYKAYVAGGWAGLSADPTHGGQGLPFTVAMGISEQLASANMAFSLCMLLSSGAIQALSAHGSDELKAVFLPNLISGEWTGTMNLTEPHAGSDVGAIRTTATPASDGSWRIKGSKIFITWGEHSLAENIVHLVLARTPGGPSGTKGISLFVVPKFLPKRESGLATRNDLSCVSIEHKLGIHASPTCTMSFGDHNSCVGWLIGAENAGMRAMFTMMNAARINVGLQGVAISERAYQGALSYARERIQSVAIGRGTPARIVEHADVRRMLMTLRATTQAIRAIAYYNAAAIDKAQATSVANVQSEARDLADFLTPITKAHCTDQGVEMASLAIQVFGGMGFIEEAGAAQLYRDIRIAPIYEGTNGIQGLDLVGRKLHADAGAHWRRLLQDLDRSVNELPGDGELGFIRDSVGSRLSKLYDAAQRVFHLEPPEAVAVASALLKMFGVVLGASLLAKQAGVAASLLSRRKGDTGFLTAKIATTAFYTQEILPQADALYISIMQTNAARLYAISEDQLAK